MTAQAHAARSKFNLPALRHELLTPLNHIVGFCDLLLEDGVPAGFSSAHQNLTRVRETAKDLVRIVREHLTPEPGKRIDRSLTEVRHQMTAPLHTILQTVGAITSEEEPGVPIADVIEIGRAAAELLSFAEGRRTYAAAPVEYRQKKTSKQPAELAAGRVLVVDDNKTSRTLLTRQLKRQGYEVTEAASGTEALATLVQSHHDLVLLDMLMPKLDGFQVLARIKADPALTGIPVIVVSALNEVPGVVRCLEMGAEDYLFKPFDPVLLAARISSSLEKKRLLDLERRRAADLEQAYQRLYVSENRLRLALAADRAALWDLDLATRRVIDLGDITKVPGHEVERPVEALLNRVHPDDREHVRRSLSEAVQAGRDFRDEYRVIASDGSIVWFEGLGTLVYGPSGKPQRMIGLTRNITRRKEVEDALRRSNQDFQRFAMAASHDLQEPLRAVANQLQTVLEHTDAAGRKTIETCAAALSRMSKLISDLLDYSQMGAKKVHQQAVSSGAVLSLVMHDLKVAIEDSGAVITHDKLPVVFADFMMLHRVFQNLITNSIKYRGVEPPRIHISAKQRDDWWIFSVADNGIGIEEKYRDAIFGVFRRLHGPDVPGSGLGLAICSRIVEQFGGKIWLESKAGKGSTFYFSVPALPAK